MGQCGGACAGACSSSCKKMRAQNGCMPGERQQLKAWQSGSGMLVLLPNVNELHCCIIPSTQQLLYSGDINPAHLWGLPRAAAAQRPDHVARTVTELH